MIWSERGRSGRGFPALETERLRLREPRRGDAARLFDAWRDEETMRFFGREPLFTRGEALAELRGFRRENARGDGIRWVLTERQSDEYIGDVGFSNLAPEHARAEVGFLLARSRWGKGLMREALGAVLDFGFGKAGLQRVEALVDPRNAACLELLARAGFRQEGILRQYEYERGAFIDLALLSILRAEWPSEASCRGCVAGQGAKEAV